MTDLQRMKQLVEVLNDYAYRYYVLDNPIVSDYDYDVLYDELLKLEKKTGKVLPSSPTLRVGGEILQGFKKVVHEEKLYSLNKCNNFEELEKFLDDTKKVVPDAKFTVEYKFDGLRIVAKYKNGLLVQASTRGNGLVGEDVTEQVKTIRSVPLSIDYKGDLTVAGEGVITLDNLEKYNRSAQEKLKNTRNAVAGAIRNLDPKETAKRNLDVVFYDLIKIDNDNLKTQEDVQNFLKKNKFLTGKLFEVCESAKDIEKIIEKVDKIKSTLQISIDGIVIKLDSLKKREELGFTSKFPKWAIAYKFAPVEATSVLRSVEWGVGRTGKITPTAVIDPVELAGATISRATLNNYDDILRKKVKIGSLVFVRRSNEVIPEILGLAQEGKNAKEIVPPAVCPSCHEPLQKNGVNIFCTNPNCREKVIAKLVYFVSKDCMNIEGLRDKIIGQLYDKGIVKSIPDLYKLTVKDLEGLEGFKDKKISNIIASIEKSKSCDLAPFIDALSIDGVGQKTSKDLAKKYKNLKAIMSATYEDLITQKDIGGVTAQNIVDFFKNKDNIEMIETLQNLGVKINEIESKEVDPNNFFYQKKFVLTGSLQNFTRSNATKIIEDFGGEVASSVSKNTDCVIYGSEAGSKLDKAIALNVKTIDEKEFTRILSDLEK